MGLWFASRIRGITTDEFVSEAVFAVLNFTRDIQLGVIVPFIFWPICLFLALIPSARCFAGAGIGYSSIILSINLWLGYLMVISKVMGSIWALAAMATGWGVFILPVAYALFRGEFLGAGFLVVLVAGTFLPRIFGGWLVETYTITKQAEELGVAPADIALAVHDLELGDLEAAEKRVAAAQQRRSAEARIASERLFGQRMAG